MKMIQCFSCMYAARSTSHECETIKGLQRDGGHHIHQQKGRWEGILVDTNS